MILDLVVAVSAALLLSLGLNRLMISFGGKLGFLDQPGERRIHVNPIPRAGGVAIWSAFMLTALGIWLIRPGLLGVFQANWLGPFAIASAILLAVGIWDDRKGLKAWWKLLGQISAALVFFLLRPGSHGHILGMTVPTGLDAAVFVCWAVLLINAFNLIDGMDGLCAGLALIALIALGAMAGVHGHVGATVVMCVMAAAICGFLRYNWNPARIFLGDAGSMLLGFFIAASGTQTAGRRAVVGALLLPIAVAGVPLLDVLLAVWRRSFRSLVNQWTGEKAVGVFAPDKDHLHHRFLAAGDGQRKVARLLHTLAAIMVLLAFLPIVFGNKVIGITVVGFLVLGLFGLRNFARIELVQSGSMLHFAAKRPIGNRRLRLTMFLYDCFALTAGAVLAVWLESDWFMPGFDPLAAVQFTVLFVVLAMGSLFFAKSYRRAWSRASIRDLVTLCIAIAAAGLVTVTLFSMVRYDVSFSTTRIGILTTFFAMVMLAFPRCGVELLRELAVDAAHRRFGKKGVSERHVVVYGCGDLGNLFIEYLKTCPPDGFNHFRVVGFIDREPLFKGRVIRGFPVLGGLDTLEKMASMETLHGVIVAISRPDPKDMARLQEISRKHGVALYSWCFDLTPSVMDPRRNADVSGRAAPGDSFGKLSAGPALKSDVVPTAEIKGRKSRTNA